jgi:serine/threonine protein kinase
LIETYESDPLIGRLFADKYEILSLLGQGGMSRVYKAKHKFMKRSVAVKVLHESAVHDGVARARFQREAEAASALSHPNVVTVHDFGISNDGRAYFTMDCLEGRSLEDILARRKFLPMQQALEIFIQGLEGLAHAHRCGVVHRDIKPSNLVVLQQEDGSDLVKIVDFGIAKITRAHEKDVRQQRITQTGEVFGTANYMSPEQCNGTSLDERSDIYSFGCLMYETLAGEPPFNAGSYVATAAKHVSEPPEPISKRASINVPPDIEKVIMKCLEKKPADRYSSAAELKQALLDAAYLSGIKGLRMGAVQDPKSMGNSGSVSAQKVMKTTQRTRNRRLRNFFAFTASTACAATVGVWVFFYYHGPAGDYGTFYDKFRWQCAIADADDLLRDGKNKQAVEKLETARDIAKSFGDDDRRMEASLAKLVEAYTANHDAVKLEKANQDLININNARVFEEYNELMAKMKQWEQPSFKESNRHDLVLQASAFGERIARCADKLSVRSRAKQEALLRRAIKVFDYLNMREGVYRMVFRVQLAELFRQQERVDEQMRILEDAVKHAPENPRTATAWRWKIKVSLLLGMIYANNWELDKAKNELDGALADCREHLPEDSDQLRDCLNASVQLYKKFETPQGNEKAAAFAKEATQIGIKQLDQVTDK